MRTIVNHVFGWVLAALSVMTMTYAHVLFENMIGAIAGIVVVAYCIYGGYVAVNEEDQISEGENDS